ncbi:MAG: hypothetical protein ABR875_02500 [Minisyncoccia bacterium]|jgi:hypothetical protein
MGTYARWVLWIGVENDEIDNSKLPQTTVELIDAVREELDGLENGGVIFRDIFMSGVSVGFGVEVKELHWNTDLDSENYFDDDLTLEITEIQLRVPPIFRRLGLPEPKLRHHIDLGD